MKYLALAYCVLLLLDGKRGTMKYLVALLLCISLLLGGCQKQEGVGTPSPIPEIKSYTVKTYEIKETIKDTLIKGIAYQITFELKQVVSPDKLLIVMELGGESKKITGDSITKQTPMKQGAVLFHTSFIINNLTDKEIKELIENSQKDVKISVERAG
jgi:hypothetical protein